MRRTAVFRFSKMQWCLFVILLIASPLFSQETLPFGFRTINLGTDIETVKEQLKAEPYFRYRGDPDVSILDTPNRTLIETMGNGYIDEGAFQFSEDRLFSIILDLDQERIDYYSVYKHLRKKYGDPKKLNPSRVVWENEQVRMSLEKPLSIKYMDAQRFNEMLESSRRGKAYQELSLSEFLEEL